MKSYFVSPKLFAILAIPVMLTACKGGGGGKGGGASPNVLGGLDYIDQLTFGLLGAVGKLPFIGWLF